MSCGDRLLLRSLRGENAGGSAEDFYSAVTERNEDTSPLFKLGDVFYYHIKRNGLYFVATTSFAIPPAFVFELINRIIGTFKDFCGMLSEESLRQNFVLAYELLDEILDFGYVQCTNTTQLKQKVCNVAVLPKIHTRSMGRLRIGASSNAKTVPSVVSQRPITGEASKSNEIFLDVLEKISAVLGPNDTYRSMTVEGQIRVKSFLRGNPMVNIALNEGIVINKRRGKVPNVAVLDFCNFHECVDTGEFEKSRVLSLSPPEGELILMSYRISGSAVMPFKIKANVDIAGDTATMIVNLFCTMPQHVIANVKLRCPLPSSTTAVALSTVPHDSGQAPEYRAKEQAIFWELKRHRGCTGVTLRASISISAYNSTVSKREFGPINLAFEAPMFSISNVQVRYLRVLQPPSAAPTYRWVRYVTSSNSYLYRF
ncbi:AP-4 complex subunit mu [Babesia sp. Xinjiang]|uniref:AP-4 complex subunit mu n=1 Tax=Babesia sp. Xinjiang TaxID=462227 RepID=UPI000A2216C2|nr:AP-4 complex subunit mu [Babesia sp. Xinjiang]ORM40975.1 AP-4 complex subunit mu [Babesia sp. Xinjiang]